MLPRGLLREYSGVLSLVARALDVVCIFSACFAAYFWRFGHLDMPAQYQIAVIFALLLSTILFSVSGIYRSWRGQDWLQQARLISLSWASTVIVLVLIAFMTKTSASFSREWMGIWVISAWVLLLVFRFSLSQILAVMRAKGLNYKRILVVGAGTLGKSVAANIQEAGWAGFKVAGFLDDDVSLKGEVINGVEVLGSAELVDQFVLEKKIDEVWLAMPLRAEKRVKDILYKLRHNTTTIRFVPGIFAFRLLNHSVTDVAGMAVMDLSTSPMVGLNRLVKAMEDRIFALVILFLISPILVFVATGVKLSSPGPVLFKQKRHGWDGKPIKIYKFRSMILHTEDDGQVSQAKKSDCRITKFGSFLRRTSLDELPQFVNVLQGRMSIVGPRPHAMAHNELYKDQIEAYMLRHKVKPGITGWAQVNGLRGETDTLDKMKKRVEFDLYYIEHWSLWFDIKIIIRTIFTGFINKNAY